MPYPGSATAVFYKFYKFGDMLLQNIADTPFSAFIADGKPSPFNLIQPQMVISGFEQTDVFVHQIQCRFYRFRIGRAIVAVPSGIFAFQKILEIRMDSHPVNVRPALEHRDNLNMPFAAEVDNCLNVFFRQGIPAFCVRRVLQGKVCLEFQESGIHF